MTNNFAMPWKYAILTLLELLMIINAP